MVAEPSDFCEQLTGRIPQKENIFIQQWITSEQRTIATLQNQAENIVWEGKIAQTIIESLPENSLLHVASGMPVRDIDGFGYKQSQNRYLCANRGVNGIDGMIATACGQAHNWKKGPCFALIGDIAFFHDMASLHTAKQQNTNITIIVIDNNGGGIFENLPIAKHPSAFEKYFLTPQNGDICAIAQNMGAQVTKINTMMELRQAISISTPRLRVLYIKVDRQKNIQQHHKIYQTLYTNK